eukprot:scaffold113977_cov28-Tisochrysis_lutea.AAC.6
MKGRAPPPRRRRMAHRSARRCAPTLHITETGGSDRARARDGQRTTRVTRVVLAVPCPSPEGKSVA